jgi:shikimate kinase
LQKIYGCNFIDIDLFIEDETGKTVRALFKEGKEIFRAAETAALRSALGARRSAAPNAPRVAAAGGGLIDNADAMALLQSRAETTIVYLELSVASAWLRVKKSAEESGALPPFLDPNDPETSHRILHERRAAAYKQSADIIINAENKSAEEIAEEIWNAARCN